MTSSYEHGLIYIDITVKPKTTIQELKVKSKPTTLNYTVGQRLNTNGMVVILKDNKGTEIVLDDSQYECSPIKLDKAGPQKITVKYKQDEKLKDTFYVTVKKPTYETEIVNYPKMEYKVGDKLNLTGLRVKLKYTSGPSNGQILYFNLNDMRTNPVNGTQLNETGTVDVTMTSNN